MPGRVDGKLKAPPPSPNCCTSVCPPSDTTHYAAPLRITGDPSSAMHRLKLIINAMPRTQLVTEDAGYLHYTFTTRILRFVDDVEFLLDADEGLIHFRSRSRLGHSDLGANRKRIEDIRARWQP